MPALFHERTLSDLVIPDGLAGKIRLAPPSDKTSHVSLALDKRRFESGDGAASRLIGIDGALGADIVREAGASTPKSEIPGAGVGAGGGSLMDLVGVRVAASG